MCSKCCKCSFHEVLYIKILSRYAKPPGREQTPNAATFQCHLPLIFTKAVFSFASGIKLIWWYPDLRSREEIFQLYNIAS